VAVGDFDLHPQGISSGQSRRPPPGEFASRASADRFTIDPGHSLDLALALAGLQQRADRRP